MKRTCQFAATFSLATVLSGCGSHAPPSASSEAGNPTSSETSPSSADSTPEAAPPIEVDPQLAAQLGDAVTFGRYSVRPPKGFKLIEEPSDSDVYRIGWQGPDRADGITPLLLITVTKAPPNADASMLKKNAEQFLNVFRDESDDFQQSPFEVIQINEREFVHATCSGTESPDEVKMYGTLYVTANSGDFVMVFCKDYEPGYAQNFEVIKASVTTLQPIDGAAQ